MVEFSLKESIIISSHKIKIHFGRELIFLETSQCNNQNFFQKIDFFPKIRIFFQKLALFRTQLMYVPYDVEVDPLSAKIFTSAP